MSSIYTSAALITQSASIGSTDADLVIDFNNSRAGMTIYNDSAADLLIMFAPLDDGAEVSPTPTAFLPCYRIAGHSEKSFQTNTVYQGPVIGKRESGSGTAVVTELIWID